MSIKPRPVILVIDTTYWGRREGLMLFRDVIRSENLLWYWCTTETNKMYMAGIQELLEKGFEILGITIDGRKGLSKRIEDLNIPVQLCQFHQVKTIKKYLTSKPKLEANQELLKLAKKLPRTDRPSFEYWLANWHQKWVDFLAEKTIDETDPAYWHYTHKRLRSAYFSLKRNIDNLFVYYTVTGMVNTTNSIDGFFSQMKSKLRVHQGLRKDRRRKLTEELLT